MSVVTTIVLGALLVAAALCIARVARPGSVADRVVALDTLVNVTAGGIAVYAARTGSGAFVIAAVVTALLAFVGTVTVARFVERRGT